MPYHGGKKVQYKRCLAGEDSALDPGKMGGGKGRRKRKERKVTVLKGCEAAEIGAGGRGVTRQSSIFRNRQKG